MKTPVRIVVTGAAGQIGYALLFRIAAGDMLGKDQPVILHLLEITPALPSLQGVVMELNDCAFPLLAGVIATDDLNVAFKDVEYAMLVGARAQRQGARGRQSCKYEFVDCPAERTGSGSGPVHRDGAPGPQPFAVAARRKNRQA